MMSYALPGLEPRHNARGGACGPDEAFFEEDFGQKDLKSRKCTQVDHLEYLAVIGGSNKALSGVSK